MKGVVIVGGSLSGLTLALACAHRGVHAQVIERTHDRQQSGSALGVDRSLLLRVIGVEPDAGSKLEPFPVLTEYRQAVSWQSLHGWLRNLARGRPEITLMDGSTVSEVAQSNVSATAITSDGERIEAQIVVGADGYRSAVRRAINPEHPNAPYAGYLLWRGLIPEESLPTETRWLQNNDGVALENEAGYRLVAYPVAGKEHSLVPGKRSISFAWYDKTRDAFLRDAGCVSTAGHVLSSLPPTSIPERVRLELKTLAVRLWPEPWSSFVGHALEIGVVFATPVAEYFPERLHRGRLAIIGDAAHVVSPVTGMGFVTGIQDAEALADSLIDDPGQLADNPSGVLERYGQARLSAAQQLVAKSMAWSRAYLDGEKVCRRLQQQDFS